MAQTVVVTEWNYTPQDGTPADWTADTSINVGSGSNRYMIVLVNYSNATTPQPATLSIGSDTLTSVVTGVNSSGFKCALFHGALTVTGTQTFSGTSTGTTGSEGGGYQTVALVVQGDGALTFGNATAFASNAVGSGSFTRTRTVTTTSGDEAWMLCLDFSGALSAVAGTGTTEVADSGLHWIGRRTASGASTDLNMDTTGANDIVYVGFRLTESGGGGGSTSLPPRRAFFSPIINC